MHKTRNALAEVNAADAKLCIRPARADEAEILTDLSLRSKAFWGYDAGFLARCRAVMTVKARNIETHPHHVAELDGRIAGFYGFEPEPGAAIQTSVQIQTGWFATIQRLAGRSASP